MNRKLIKSTQALVTMMAPVKRFLCGHVSCGSCFMSHTNRSAKDQFLGGVDAKKKPKCNSKHQCLHQIRYIVSTTSQIFYPLSVDTCLNSVSD